MRNSIIDCEGDSDSFKNDVSQNSPEFMSIFKLNTIVSVFSFLRMHARLPCSVSTGYQADDHVH